MNKRRIKRRRLRISTRLEPGHVTSYTGDVTTGGVFVYSARVHPPGTVVRLAVRTSGGPLEARGVVRWAKRVPSQFLQHVRGGMGIEFTWVSPELETYLFELMPRDIAVRAES